MPLRKCMNNKILWEERDLPYQNLAHKQVFEYFTAIRIAKDLRSSSFRMGHHAENVPVFIANTGNISNGAIRVCAGFYFTFFVAIIKYHLSFSFELVKRFFISIIPSFAVSDGYFINFTAFISEENIFTGELLMTITQ